MRLDKEGAEMSDILRERYSYDAESGKVTNLKTGKSDWSCNALGYQQIGVMIGGASYTYRVHRLAWMLYTGAWPSSDLDHIDRDKLNNRITNLREATRQENIANRSNSLPKQSDYLGVSWYSRVGKWVAQLPRKHCKLGKRIYVGLFHCEHEAHRAILNHPHYQP